MNSGTPYPPLEVVRLDDTTAVVHGALGSTGVILCNDWGYEGLCAHRMLRILADGLATDGYPSIRFDYPGLGNSSANAVDVQCLAEHQNIIFSAANCLANSSGVEKLILVGIGFGALLAANIAQQLPLPLAASVLFAPPKNGRGYLRELQLRASMIAEVTRVKPDIQKGASLNVAGLSMADSLATEIKDLKLSPTAIAPDVPVLIFPRPGRVKETEIAEEIMSRETKSETAIFMGYDALMTDPTAAVTPDEEIQKARSWIKSVAPARAASQTTCSEPDCVLEDLSFSETTVTFGPENNLVGTWCTPNGAQKGVPILFLNAGGTPRAGWARNATDGARWLAGAGIPSFRIDCADIGDSRPARNGPEIVHYNVSQLADLSAALDHLGAQNIKSVIAAGTCSGAYLALRGAISDPRIADVVAVNLQRFLWDPRDDIANALRFDHTSTSDYGRKFFSPEKVLKLLSGRVAVLPLARFLVKRLLKKAEYATAPFTFGLSPYSRIFAQVHRELDQLVKRDVGIKLLFSVGDPGLSHVQNVLGKSMERSEHYPTMRITMIENADHNLTSHKSQQIYLDTLANSSKTRYQQDS
ncbi:alpha/beta fold hydrolase [Labrenzia sp. CE80]|uniref:alpha/beta fold hydrolase n=1 Tax=Labrenzia sp. CE80 TaxID=1788986 RepID=UPI00129BA54A|nr:alpha/beta fold hydrolase [Labrenzia sp. CE80]